MNRVQTTKIQGGAEYAKVSDRIKAFRSENPRASIVTTPIIQEDGIVMFKACVVRDKADENSAEATGHALQTKSGTKDFEKLETIAVGRALALLGYAADGEIASSEEMEEFEAYKKQKLDNEVEIGRDLIQSTKSKDELMKAWLSLSAEAKRELEDIKNEKKKIYEN